MSFSVALCDDITAFKDFLRLSRGFVDDTITQNLNNLVLPTRFDPTSTSRQQKKRLSTPIDRQSCDALLDTVLENWDARSKTIETCLQRIRMTKSSPQHEPTQDEIRARRLDPYSGRHQEEEPMLKRVCEQELGTERIIRDRTWRIIRSRCDELTGMSEDWQTAYDLWKSKRAVT